MQNPFTHKLTAASSRQPTGATSVQSLNLLLKNAAESIATLDCDNMPKLLQFLKHMQASDTAYAPFVVNNITEFISWYTSKSLSPFQPECLSSEILADQIMHLSMFNDGLFRFVGCFSDEENKDMDSIATYLDDIIEIYVECYATTVQVETSLRAKSKTA